MTFSEYFSPDNLRKNKKILIWIILIIVLLIIVIIGIVLWLKFRPEEAIVFGTEAKKGEFPHHVIIATPQQHVYCGGSIISPIWIITALHCKLVGAFPHIIAGSNEISSTGPNDQVRIVVRYLYYEPYSEFSDFVLFKLDRNLEYTNYVRPIPLPMMHEYDLGAFIVVGHGLTEDHVLKDRLQKATVIVESAYTFTLHSTYNLYRLNGSGPCVGDSGGGLVRKNYDGTYTLMGIIIEGNYDCVASSRYSEYSRISYYVDWIIKTINQKNKGKDKPQ